MIQRAWSEETESPTIAPVHPQDGTCDVSLEALDILQFSIHGVTLSLHTQKYQRQKHLWQD